MSKYICEFGLVNKIYYIKTVRIPTVKMMIRFRNGFLRRGYWISAILCDRTATKGINR